MSKTLYVCNIILSIIVPWPVFVYKFCSYTFEVCNKDPKTSLMPSSACTYCMNSKRYTKRKWKRGFSIAWKCSVFWRLTGNDFQSMLGHHGVLFFLTWYEPFFSKTEFPTTFPIAFSKELIGFCKAINLPRHESSSLIFYIGVCHRMEQGCSQVWKFLFLTASDSKQKGIPIFCDRKSSTKEARGLLRCCTHTRTAGTQNNGVRGTQAKAA